VVYIGNMENLIFFENIYLFVGSGVLQALDLEESSYGERGG